MIGRLPSSMFDNDGVTGVTADQWKTYIQIISTAIRNSSNHSSSLLLARHNCISVQDVTDLLKGLNQTSEPN